MDHTKPTALDDSAPPLTQDNLEATVEQLLEAHTLLPVCGQQQFTEKKRRFLTALRAALPAARQVVGWTWEHMGRHFTADQQLAREIKEGGVQVQPIAVEASVADMPLACPTVFELPHGVRIERMTRMGGRLAPVWAVRCDGYCLGAEGWELDSGSTVVHPAFQARCRYASAQEAYQAWAAALFKTPVLAG